MQLLVGFVRMHSSSGSPLATSPAGRGGALGPGRGLLDGLLNLWSTGPTDRGYIGPLSQVRGVALLPGIFCCLLILTAQLQADEPTIDPAAWGADHVGQTFPDYLTGDECLFCHRKIGPTWDVNPHQRTFQRVTPDSTAVKVLQESDQDAAKQTQLLLGAKRVTRFLRKSKQYGKMELLNAKYIPDLTDNTLPGSLSEHDSIQWDSNVFADRCAGCHTTAVDTTSRTFSSISLDCVTCHGLVELEHTDDTSKVFLSKQSRGPKQVISICGQCHLRGGKSKSSGLPYANTFVPGDNLFRDFEIDLSAESIGKLPTAQRHISMNTRDVVLHDQSAMTCITCHDIHQPGSQKHQDLEDAAICASCHKPNTDNSELLDSFKLESKQRIGNKTCDY